MDNNVFYLFKNPNSMLGALMGVTCMVLAGCASQPTVSQKSTNAKTNPNIVVKNGVPSHYQVQSGDTVVKLAKRYDLNWREISAINRLDANHTIYIGQWLMLWQPKASSAEASKPIPAPTPILKETIKQNVGQVQTQRAFPIITQTPKPTPKPTPIANEKVVDKVDVKSDKADVKSGEVEKVEKVVESPIQKISQEPTPQAQVVQAPTVSETGLPMLMPMGKTPLIGSSAVRHFRYPVSTQNKVVRQFGSMVNGAKSDGMFFSGHDGDVIVASQSGIVIYADDNGGKGDRPKAVVVEHLDGYVSTYIHLKDIAVKKGQNVAVGASIGSMQAQAGNLALFEFRMAKDGHYIDPVSVLK